MPANVPFFQIPLNLPHAARVARRIVLLLPPEGRRAPGASATPLATALKLEALLAPCADHDDNPAPIVAKRIREEAAALGRQIADQIKATPAAGHDRLGQSVRNLFECLELGREGSALGLVAGENPNSLQRPT
jgi:hypothetical protein